MYKMHIIVDRINRLKMALRTYSVLKMSSYTSKMEITDQSVFSKIETPYQFNVDCFVGIVGGHSMVRDDDDVHTIQYLPLLQLCHQKPDAFIDLRERISNLRRLGAKIMGEFIGLFRVKCEKFRPAVVTAEISRCGFFRVVGKNRKTICCSAPECNKTYEMIRKWTPLMDGYE